MKFPTKYTHYGYGWLDPILQGFHPGIDYNFGKPYEDEGQDVIVITDGKIIYAKSNTGWGWHILIYHEKYSFFSHYAHLQSICVRETELVKEGDLIGFLGGTGGNWPPHLHFEIRLKNFSPNKYVTGMSIEDVKSYYGNPEECFKKYSAEISMPQKDVPIIELKKVNPLSERLKGRILLQVESHHEAWYINPIDGKRYYLKDGEEALRIMKEFGLGITNSDLEKIPKGEISQII